MNGVRIASVVVLLAALVVLGRMAVFMADPDQTQLSIAPRDTWRVEHSCLTAYTEAARFAEEPATNIYAHELYFNGKAPRHIGKLKVDAYHYPPPFLLVPGLLQEASGSYEGTRPLWFAFQLALLVGALLVVARWIGGREGEHARYASALVLIAPPTLFTLQMGNFQITAVGLALVGMIGLCSAKPTWQAAGGGLFAFAALGKVFPGVLGVYLIVTRRWRALGWVAAASLLWIALALFAYGAQPFEDFVSYQMPRLSSGEAFPQSELPRITATNYSFYGMLVKLRALGVPGLGIENGLRLNSIFGLLVIVAAGLVAWRWHRRGTDAVLPRLESVQLWLALIGLASFRSPFVGGAYGVFSTVWLVTLLLVGARTHRERAVWAALYLAFCAASWFIPTPIDTPATTTVVIALCAQLAAFAVNVFVVVRAARSIPRSVMRRAHVRETPVLLTEA